MLFNTALVIVIGICQITIGVLIELYSVGIMTNVGNAFIGEGISDLIFATSALASGHFSWKDYRQHKIQSLILTTVTFGIASFWSRGVKLSHFGHKVAGSSLQISEQKLAETAGKQLLQSLPKTATNIVTVSVTKQVAKRICLKTLEGIAFGMTNSGIDKILQNHLNTFSKSLSFVLLSKIEEKVQEHHISLSLRECYQVMGEKDANNLVTRLTQSLSKDKTFVEGLLFTLNQITTSIIQGITNATEKISKANNSDISMLAKNINNISKVITWTKSLTHISNVVFATNYYLDKMDKKIQNELSDYKLSNLNNKTGKQNILDETEKKKKLDEMKDVDKYKSFEYKTINQWKLILREKAQETIKQHVIDPLMTVVTKQLVKYLGKMIKHGYQHCKENKYFEEFQKLQKDHKQKVQDISEDSNDNVNEVKETLKKDYNNNLIKLLGKTKNPVLFAAIIEECIPMESICIKSCVTVIPNALKNKGIIIKPFTVNVEEENGVQVSVSSEKSTKGNIINLKLINNHFTLCNDDSSNISENNINNKSENDRNNCLFEALRRKIPELNNITAKEFRKLIANHIRNDPDIKYTLAQGWHRLPLAFNMFGGAAREKKKITTFELREKLKDGSFKFSQNSVALHTKDDHKHIGELSEEIQKKWDGKPVRVVEVDKEKYIALDHRRVLATAIADNPKTEMAIAVYGPDDEFSNENENYTNMENYGKRQTAGDLLSTRIKYDTKRRNYDITNSDDINKVGLLANQVTVRVTESKYHDAERAEKKLENIGFIMGGIRKTEKYNKHRRSKSSSRYDKGI